MANPRLKVSKQLILAKTLALLVLLLLSLLRTTFGVYSDHIDVGFAGSAMAFVDSDGVFLYSVNSSFSMSFFTSQGQLLYYLCVIHATSQHIVWTANRGTPVSNSDQMVFSKDGNAALIHKNGSTVWSTNTAGLGGRQMQLQESGNLVVLDGANKVLWQSFDHPTDTLLSGQLLRPGMRLVSSVSSSNNSAGSYFLAMQSGDLRLFLDFNPPQPYWSMSQDNRIVSSSSGTPSYARLDYSGLSLVRNDSTAVSEITWRSSASLCMASLGSDGNLNIYVYSAGVWTPQYTALQSDCWLPLYCGPYGICAQEQCNCPRALQPLNGTNPAQGCQGPASSPCTNSSSVQYEKAGDGLEYFANQFTTPVKTSGVEACQKLCIENCSCTSFFFYKESGSCFLLSQVATIQNTGNSNHSLYMKASLVQSPEANPSPLVASPVKSGAPHFVIPVLIGGTAFIIIAMMSGFAFWFYQVRKKTVPAGEDTADDDIFLDSIPGLPARFSFKELEIATNHFCKKLGTGGFGSVYEGVLPDKTKVAVKQLESLGQGKKEFRAEVAIIGSIHHVHLVQLRGFCAEGAHRLLVYEFMSNGSLDRCLFVDGEKSHVLDWNTRYNIALGTARGLAYLHDDCREKIIHCDIKPENILLDENYNSKVSDFGLAKLMNKEQSQVFTTLRGTRGYLAPEWLMNLAISEKSDVYSFGMVLLEIISGRKNFDPSETSEKWYFPAYAFQQAEHGKLEDLVDVKLRGSASAEQVTQVVKVALWCIQEDTQVRPSMGKVVLMLEGNVQVPQPPLSSQFAVRLHARMVEAVNSTEQLSSGSDLNSQDLLSATRLSGPR